MGDEKKHEPHAFDLTSPYHLGSGDQPQNLITHVVLTRENYSAWTRAITLSLKARRMYGFIDGTDGEYGDS